MTCVDCSVNEFQNGSSSSSSSIVVFDGIKISSKLIVLVLWYGIDVSLFVREFDINCDDDDADCGGDRNVWLFEIVVIDSDGWESRVGVDRLSQSVRNFPWLSIVDDRLDISTPSTLTNSVSKKKWKLENLPTKKSN